MATKTRKTPRSHAAGTHSRAHRDTNANAAERRFLEKHRDQLSPSTLRARWIHTPDEHAERPGQTLATRSHDVIRHWAKERGGVPATVQTAATKDRPRVLRIDFPGFATNRRLREVNWDDWFQTFDDRKLVFLFQQQKKSGETSNFFRLDSPLREDG
jgi:hypothetical protein